jgi:multiple sugar transport system permease protein
MKRKKILHQSILTILLIIGAIVMVFPFLYMISTALKGPVFVFEFPPRLIPSNPTLQNFITAITKNNFGLYFWNSTYISILSVSGILLFGSMMAYALARFRFPGRNLVYALILFFMTMPAMSLIVPQFVLANRLNVTDSALGLIFMDMAQNLPFAVFLLEGFIREVPIELEEAAKIDGASPATIFIQIVMPVCKPALATSAIIAFLGVWDEYVWSSTIINTPEKRTIPVAIASFQGVHTTNWGLVFAASLIAVIPVLILFVSLQKYFIKGMTAGAVKG